MTEAELRRVELLAQTRSTYKERGNIPAIHPRYRSVYNEVYGDNATSSKDGVSFRLAIALFIFVVYAMISYKEYSFGEFNNETIVEAISTDIEVVNVWNSW